MSDRLGEQAVALRDAFDRAFALPVAGEGAAREDVLSVRVSGAPYAIRLSDIAGIIACPTIIPVPATAPGLLGLAGIRGEIVPMFGLAEILGHPPPTEPPRWCVLHGTESVIALAFSELEGYVRVPRDAIHRTSNTDGRVPFVDEAVTVGDGARPIIGVGRVIESIRNQREDRHG